MSLLVDLRFDARPSARKERFFRDTTITAFGHFRDAETRAYVAVSGVAARAWIPGGALLSPAPTVAFVRTGVWSVTISAAAAAYAGDWRIEISCTAPSAELAVRDFVLEAPEPDVSAPPAPTPVLSVAGRTGAVALAVADVFGAAASSRLVDVGAGLTGGGDFSADRTIALSAASQASLLVADHLGRAHGRVIDEFGTVDRTGLTDMTTLIQTAMAACSDEQVPLIFGPGDYSCDSNLTMLSNLTIDLAGGRLLRRYTENINFFNSHIGLLNVTNFHIRNGTLKWMLDDGIPAGSWFSGYVADSTWHNLFIDDWGGGRAAILRAERCMATNIRAISQYDGGGWIWLSGSKDSVMAASQVWCGDDALQIASNNGGASLDTERCHYVGCTAQSWNARLFIVGCSSVNGHTANIRDCSIDVIGKTRAAGIIDNTAGPGVIERVAVRLHGDTSMDGQAGNGSLTILAAAGSGGVRDVDIYGAYVSQPYNEALEIRANGPIRGLRFWGGYFGPSRTAVQTGKIDGDVDVSFHGTTFDCRSDTNGLSVGLFVTGSRVRFKGCQFKGIGDGRLGVTIPSCAWAEISGNRFTAAAGSTTALAFSVTSTATNVIVGPNEYDVPGVQGFTWAPADTASSEARGGRDITIDAATTLRNKNSGSTVLATGGSSQTVTLPVARPGLMFSGIQLGAGALVFDATGSNTIQLAETVSNAGGTITSGSVGATVTLIGRTGGWLAMMHTGTWTVST